MGLGLALGLGLGAAVGVTTALAAGVLVGEALGLEELVVPRDATAFGSLHADAMPITRHTAATANALRTLIPSLQTSRAARRA